MTNTINHGNPSSMSPLDTFALNTLKEWVVVGEKGIIELNGNKYVATAQQPRMSEAIIINVTKNGEQFCNGVYLADTYHDCY